MRGKFFTIFFICIILGGIFFSIPQKSFAQQFCESICNECYKGVFGVNLFCAQQDCNSQFCDYIPNNIGIVNADCKPKLNLAICQVRPPATQPPAGTSSSDGGATFITFLNWLFPALLSLAAFLAFVMIVLAGFKWIAAAGNPSTIEDAKDMITKAVIGLVLAFVSWLILHTINPALVGGGLPVDGNPPAGQQNPDPGNQNPPAAGTLSEQEARDLLAAAGITVNKSPCPAGVRYQDVPGGCTSLEGIPASTVNSLISIKQNAEANCQCSVNIIITGGTELGHQTHGPGLPVVDLGFNDALANYLINNTSSAGISSICTDASHAQLYSYNCSYIEPEVHLHVVF